MSRFPRLLLDTEKLTENYRHMTDLCHQNGVSVAAVTKCCFSASAVVNCAVAGGADYIADSRISTLEKISSPVPRMCTRSTVPGEEANTVAGCEISLESSPEILPALSDAAVLRSKMHRVMLMVDLGDLREGVWFEDREGLFTLAEAVLREPGLELYGLGTNLSCFGGILPDENNLRLLVDLAEELRARYNIPLPLVSGGATSSLPLLLNGTMPIGITNLRLGECCLTGMDTSNHLPVPGQHRDAFLLETKIIEIRQKPSIPVGPIGVNAFGETPHFPDEGTRRRAMCAMGRVDTDLDALTPQDTRLRILGGSSDHTILDVTAAPELQVGDVVRFIPGYAALMRSSLTHYEYGRVDI